MPLSTSLLAYYKFDSSNSNDSVGSNNGSDTAITYSSGNGKINIGAGFNGTTSQISLSAMGFGVSDDISWGGWVNLSSTSGDRTIFANDGGSTWSFLLRYDSASGKFIAATVTSNPGTSQNTATGTTSPSTGTWYHVIGVWKNGTSIKIYVNGSLEGTTNTGNTVLRNSALGSYIGSFGGGGGFISGALDEMGFWNRELTLTDVQELYNGGTGFQYPFIAHTFDPMSICAF